MDPEDETQVFRLGSSALTPGPSQWPSFTLHSVIFRTPLLCSPSVQFRAILSFQLLAPPPLLSLKPSQVPVGCFSSAFSVFVHSTSRITSSEAARWLRRHRSSFSRTRTQASASASDGPFSDASSYSNPYLKPPAKS